MMTKANKSTVQELIEEQNRVFIKQTYLDEIDTKFNNLLDKIEEKTEFLSEEVNRAREQQIREVQISVETTVSEKLEEYAGIAK